MKGMAGLGIQVDAIGPQVRHGQQVGVADRQPTEALQRHLAGIPVPERGAEVGVRRLLRPGDGIKQVAGQVGGAVLPQTDASPASPAPRPPPPSGSRGPPR